VVHSREGGIKGKEELEGRGVGDFLPREGPGVWKGKLGVWKVTFFKGGVN